MANSTIDTEALEQLKAAVGGAILQDGDPGYDEARHVYNGMIDRRPLVIVQCAGTADVAAAVTFAREHELVLSVRGGGHNVAGSAVCDGGLMIDMSHMRGIRVDPAAQTARAQGGATWADFDRECQLFGLASTGGLISSTGIAGLTLGGGFGWLGRSYGMACDNLVSADVVLADGSVVTASESENADLFWGLRGGGGNFGVVTSFEYRVHPVGPMLGGLLLFPFDRAREILFAYREIAAAAPDALTMMAAVLTPPPVGAPALAILVGYNGPPEEGAALIQPLKDMQPLADMTGPMGYRQLQQMLDADFPFGLQNYWKSDFLSGLTDGVIDTVLEHYAKATSPMTAIVIEQFGGAYRRMAPGATAFSHRDWDFNLLILSRWEQASESERHIEWTRNLWNSLQPFAAGGVYVNYLEAGQEGADRIRKAYGPSYERLAALKKQYDPTNLFSMNQNVRPA